MSKNREGNQLRQFSVEFGVLKNCDSSVRYSHGDTQVIVSLHGPTEVKPRDELCDKASFEVLFRPRSGQISDKEKSYEQILANSLVSSVMDTMYPRSLISLVVQVINDDGALLSVAANACVLALLDGGISLKSVLVSSTVALSAKKQIILDPSMEDEKSSVGISFFILNSTTQELVATNTTGIMSSDEYLYSLKAAKSTIASIREFVMKSITKSIE